MWEYVACAKKAGTRAQWERLMYSQLAWRHVYVIWNVWGMHWICTYTLHNPRHVAGWVDSLIRPSLEIEGMAFQLSGTMGMGFLHPPPQNLFLHSDTCAGEGSVLSDLQPLVGLVCRYDRLG